MNNWLKSKREEARAFDNLGLTEGLATGKDLKDYSLRDMTDKFSTYSIQDAMDRHRNLIWTTIVDSAENGETYNNGKIFEGMADNDAWHTLSGMLHHIRKEGGKKRDFRFYGPPRVVNSIRRYYNEPVAEVTSMGTITFQGIPFVIVEDMPANTLILAHADIQNSVHYASCKPVSVLKNVIGDRIQFQIDATGDMAIEVYNE